MAIPTTPGISLKFNKSGCTPPYTWDEALRDVRSLYDQKRSLRRIAKEDYRGEITHATVQRILEGAEPKDPKIRAAIGLPAYQQVVAVTGEAIPTGAQVISASYCKVCGRPFISNHPRRRKCFICGPYRKSK